MTAALYGDAALVRELLDAGADPNIANDAGATALMWAVDDLEKTRALVEHGADVNAISANRRRAILAACTIRRNREVVAYLLDHGANPSEKAPGLNDGTAPLTEAALLGDEDLIRLLLDRGANAQAAGFLPLALSMRARCNGCVEALMPKLRPEQVLTPLMLMGAPPRGPALSAASLLARGADANAKGANGYPMLLLAAASNIQSVDAVRALLDKGADVNATGPHGETALRFARLQGASPLVDVLLKAGAKGDDPPVPVVTFAPVHVPGRGHSAKPAVAAEKRRDLPAYSWLRLVPQQLDDGGNRRRGATPRVCRERGDCDAATQEDFAVHRRLAGAKPAGRRDSRPARHDEPDPQRPGGRAAPG